MLTAGFSAILLAGSIWSGRRRRRLSPATVLVFLAGVLMLVSTSIDEGYAVVIRPLSADVQDSVRRITDFTRLADGMNEVAFGFLFMAISQIGSQRLRKRQNNNKAQSTEVLLAMILTSFMGGLKLITGSLKIWLALQ